MRRNEWSDTRHNVDLNEDMYWMVLFGMRTCSVRLSFWGGVTIHTFVWSGQNISVHTVNLLHLTFQFIKHLHVQHQLETVHEELYLTPFECVFWFELLLKE